jgi:hypothetical protein
VKRKLAVRQSSGRFAAIAASIRRFTDGTVPLPCTAPLRQHAPQQVGAGGDLHPGPHACRRPLV